MCCVSMYDGRLSITHIQLRIFVKCVCVCVKNNENTHTHTRWIHHIFKGSSANQSCERAKIDTDGHHCRGGLGAFLNVPLLYKYILFWRSIGLCTTHRILSQAHETGLFLNNTSYTHESYIYSRYVRLTHSCRIFFLFLTKLKYDNIWLLQKRLECKKRTQISGRRGGAASKRRRRQHAQ